MSKQLFEEMQQSFLDRCQLVENGDSTFLDVATEFKNEMDFLNELHENRKAWLNENVESIVSESEAYGKEGYKGLIFKKQVTERLSFKNIKKWQEASQFLKDIESESKLALQLSRKGGLSANESGEEIELPEVSITSFIKTEKIK